MAYDLEHDLRSLLSRESGRDAFAVSLEEDVLEALAFDSLDKLELISTVEQHFDILIPDERISEIRTISDLLSVVAEPRSSPSQAA